MKKLFIAVIMMFVLIISNGCEKTTANNIKEIKNLVQQEIFTQEDQRYYIFFYRDNCGDCEKVKPFVLDYVEDKEKLLLVKKLIKEKKVCHSLFYKNDKRVMTWKNFRSATV